MMRAYRKSIGYPVAPDAGRDGAVLIVALWVLILLSLLVSSIVFDMQVEAKITSHYRKRFKAQYMARAGMEWAKLILSQAESADSSLEDEFPDLYLATQNLVRGVGVRQYRHQLGEGSFELDLIPEQGRRNVNRLAEEDWREILDQSGITDFNQQDELIGAFIDWVDSDDFTYANGAESDDAFYQERGYKVKNAPVDTINELLLIKGFTESVVYGGPSELEDEPAYRGIAGWLTPWGDGRVNVNSANREVLLTLVELDEFMVDSIIEQRAGIDGTLGTEDDGFSSVDEVLSVTGAGSSLRGRITVDERRFVRVTSIGEMYNIRTGVWCIFRQQGDELIPVFWREELMP